MTERTSDRPWLARAGVIGAGVLFLGSGLLLLTRTGDRAIVVSVYLIAAVALIVLRIVEARRRRLARGEHG